MTKTMIMDKIKLATRDACNETAERSDKLRQDNALMNFINKKKTMITIEETKQKIL